ncbi:hypothetical protein QR680_010253 [Steinernema hermaphroditum]|uniref:G-protein coupled receptors family 1 profile domain-containing protein n=1 Tax=Steinernema hermaphroditum TaxID=289476 RepID=A0AA39IQZ2_9BILA|nr:hypothetical protein QR680_010253 [Steinernema hermaphroditum]
MVNHLIIINIFLRHPTFKNQICYRLMANLSVFEFLIALGYMSIGMFTLYQDTLHQLIENFFCGLTFAGGLGVYSLTTLIAFNRFAALSDLPRISDIRPSFYKSVTIIIWLICCLYQLLLFTPLLSFTFYYDVGMAVMEPSTALAPFFNYCFYHYYLLSIGTSLLLYLLAAVMLIRRRRRINFQSERLLSKAEKKLLMVAFVTCLVCCLDVLITYYGIPYFFPDSLEAAIQMLLVQWNFGFVNPILYVLINSCLLMAQESALRSKNFTNSIDTQLVNLIK